MFNVLKDIRYLGVSILLTFISLGATAQQRIVQGTIVDLSDNNGLPGVTVQIKGTTQGTVTDVEGKYSISVPDDKTILIFSYIGYNMEEIEVGNRTTLNVELSPSLESLSEVVVVGYGTQKKKDLTGSVASVPMKDIENIPITRPDQILQGRISGVQITQTNAEPGGNISIRIRGTNSINTGNEPLFVVDGFPGAGDLNTINPNDIESIDVLKDASATAIYGSRGANGVVIITTKKGKAGRNTVSFDMYQGVQEVRKKYDLMGAQDFARYLNNVQDWNNKDNNTSLALPFTEEQIQGLGGGTNWQNELFRPARMSNYQLAFNGGNDETRYNLSFNYFDQEGIIINSGFKRASVRLNLDRKISKKINFSFTSQLTRSWEKQALVNTAGGSAGGVVMDALRMSPLVPVRDTDGNYTVRNAPLQYVDNQVGNPIAYANRVKDNRNMLRGLLNAAGEYEIVKNLKLRVSGGVNLLYEDNNTFIPSGLWYQSTNWNGSGNKASENNYSWINENTLTYDRTIGSSHALNVVVGFSSQEFYREDFSTSANNFFTNTLGTDELGFGALVNPPASSKSRNSLASYFGRINYRLLDKYLVTFTMRADGSSRFGANNKWGYFPSAAFAWRVIDEDFMKNLAIFSDLKLRTSFGITGNQEIGSYQSSLRYQNFGAHNNRTDYISNGTRLIGVARANIPNPDLSWESTRSFNIGVDLAVFQNRISFTADYYQKKTNDLLLNVSIPQTTGHNSILLNAGSVENKGIELALNTVNVKSGKLEWTSNLNFSRNVNKVTDLNGETQRIIGQASNSIFAGNNPGTNVLKVGEPIGSFYGYQFDGIWQTQEEIIASGITTPVLRAGDPRYVDQDTNGIINASDRVIIGRAQPDFIYGFTNNLTYGPFNLTILLQGVQGPSVLNLNRYELENGMTSTNKLTSVNNDSWTGPGTSNTLPKVNSIVRRSTGITSDLVEDASFLRVKTVSLGYNIPLSATVAKVLKSASIYVTAQNLLTFTKYSGYDPEVNSFGTSNDPNSSPNTDYNAYPSSRTFIGGIKLGF